MNIVCNVVELIDLKDIERANYTMVGPACRLPH